MLGFSLVQGLVLYIFLVVFNSFHLEYEPSYVSGNELESILIPPLIIAHT